MKRRDSAAASHKQKQRRASRGELSELPIDIWRLIAEYLPLHVRFNVLSFVSKKLLRAARESITCLPGFQIRIVRVLDILPNLSSICLNNFTLPSLPRLTKVTSLTTAVPEFTVACAQQLSNLRALRLCSLEAAGVLRFCRTSLTSIHLSVTKRFSDDEVARFCKAFEMDLPRLTAVAIDNNFMLDLQHLGTILEAIPLARLSSLSLSVSHLSFAVLRSVVHLTRLEAMRNVSGTLSVVQGLHTLCPNLQSMHVFVDDLADFGSLLTASSSLVPLVSSLKVLGIDRTIVASELPLFPRLEVLSVPTADLRTMTNVPTTLSTLVCTTLPHAALPHLRYLRLHLQELKFNAAMKVLLGALDQCPHLQVLQAVAPTPFTQKDLQSLDKLLHAVDSRFIEELWLGTVDTAWKHRIADRARSLRYTCLRVVASVILH